MRSRHSFPRAAGRRGSLALCAGLLLLVARAAAWGGEPGAGEVLKASGISGGLLVHLAGDRDAGLACEAAAGRFVVQIVCPDAAGAARLRAAVRERKLGGRVFVDTGRPGRVPFADGIVNLLVVEDSAAPAGALDLGECFRAVAPGGAACFGAGVPADRLAAAGFTGARQVGGYTVARKPRPATLDDWTHARHGPDRTNTSGDLVVGPPRELRWVDGPRRSTYHQGAPVAAVSAGGRFFCMADGAMPFTAVPSRLELVARDAYSGAVLWSVPIRGNKTWQTTPDAGTLVAAGDRVYAVTSANGPAVCLDAATGEVLRSYEGTRPTEMLLGAGLLVLSEGGAVRALDPQSGAVKWSAKVEGRDNTLLLGGGKLFVLGRRGKGLTCLEAVSGNVLWTKAEPAFQGKGLSGFAAGTLVLAGDAELAGVSADAGKLLWRHAYRKSMRSHGAGIFFPENLVWVCNKSEKNSTYGPGEWQGLDPASGQVKRSFPGQFTDKCAPGVATRRFLVTGRLDFFDARDGKMTVSPAARGVCRFGSVLANGLVYTFPNDCTCAPYVNGQMALAGAPETPDRPGAGPDSGERLVRGPGSAAAAGRPAGREDWPVYRHDLERSGSTATALPAELRELWTAELGGRLSAPTVADGRAFVAAVDEGRVHALDAADGRRLWSFDAGGRVDAPPTCHQGLAIFGSRDGRVYCLDAASGQLVWSFRAAPAERKIMAHGQPESAWPVSGSLPVIDGRVIAAAGRHTALDGGMRLCALEAATGRLLWEKTPPGPARADLLVRGGALLTMGELRFDPATGEAPGPKAGRSAALAFGSSFDDPSYSVRTQWRLPGGAVGQMLCGDDRRALGFHGNREKDKYSITEPGKGQYRLFLRGEKANLWETALSIRPSALLLAGDRACAAGAPDAYPFEGGRLHWYAAADGKELGRLDLGATPTHDGLAAAAGRLYVSTVDGRLRCFGAR